MPNTIIEVPLSDEDSAGPGATPAPLPSDAIERQRQPAPEGCFRIRAADHDGHRSEANILLERMYSWRGYHGARLPEQSMSRITLSATLRESAIGTLTLNLDAEEGLLSEEAYPKEIAGLRAQGRKLCEFTKLAIDHGGASKRVLASLFHTAYIYGHFIHNCDIGLLEVNPRHAKYYQRILNCQILGSPRVNFRVNAPVVLLGIDFFFARSLIARMGGSTQPAPALERSLFPQFFSEREESAIIARLQQFCFPEARATDTDDSNPAAAPGHATPSEP